MNWMQLLTIAAAVVVGVVGSARVTRLVVADAFPPIAHFRAWWANVTSDKDGNEGSWTVLFSCPWCAAPYIVAANMAWALLSDLHWSWWLFNGWMSAAYATSWIVFHDED